MSCIGVRVRVSFFGSFRVRVRVRAGVGVRFWLLIPNQIIMKRNA